MTDSIHWIAIDFDEQIPTEGEMESITESIDETLDGDSIVTTREVEPMDREERERYVEQLVEALEE